MRPGAPGGADDADAKGRVRHVVMSAPTAVRRSPSGSSALRCDPSRVPVPSGTVRYVPTLRARACRSEEHTSELQSLMRISYAVFCLKKKTIAKVNPHIL